MKDTGLTEKEWEQIRTVFRAVPAIEKAVLFGSRAMGLARGNSDVDIMLYGEELTMGDVAHARALLEETTLPYQFDLVLHDAENKTLQEHVRQYGKVIVGRVTQATDTPLWRKSTWGNEVRLEYGKALRDYNPHYGKFRVYGSNGPIGWAKTALADGPGVILGRKGAYRGVEYSREPFFVIDTAYYVVPLTEIDMRWLYYAIKHYKLGEIDDGSPIPSTTRSAVYTKSINVPPFLEQKQISHYLGMVDDRIQLLHETNTTLEAMAQALFKSWFVDFDPVHAKAEGCTPEGMDAEIAALFPDEFEESELGMIPTSWKNGTLAYLASLNPESWTAKNHPDQINYVDLANVKDNIIFNVLSMPFCDAPSRARRILQSGDTIVGTVRPGNRSFAHIRMPSEQLTGSTGFAVLRPKSPMYAEFIYLAATSSKNIEKLAHIADGAAYPAVRPEAVVRLACILPDEVILQAFHKQVFPFFSRIAINHEQIRSLTKLRDTLLPRLISGKLRLPEFAEAVDEATA